MPNHNQLTELPKYFLEFCNLINKGSKIEKEKRIAKILNTLKPMHWPRVTLSFSGGKFALRLGVLLNFSYNKFISILFVFHSIEITVSELVLLLPNHAKNRDRIKELAVLLKEESKHNL